ncbi:MAG: hypothetical protein BGO01_12955 [Armatimonadetes bacterium 55-13]|nr:hypothetical protein [Armatimonadota bacterium]OJU61818.1 MAG: hypothetical protein BGO01_12955 [Armatimonadetes bacterium 55-13]
MICALIASIAIAGCPLADRLHPEPLDSFNGGGWSGLRLGRMTDKDLKKAFETDRGAVRPEALVVKTDDKDVRVDALLDGRGDSATMQAIRIEYKSGAPKMDALQESWGEEPVEYWAADRTEDWKMFAFRKRGVIAVTEDGSPRPQVFILTDPDRLEDALYSMETSETDIVPPRDPGKDWDRVIRYRDVTASVSLDSSKPSSFDKDWRDNLKRRFEDQGEDYRRGGLRYDRYGGNGSLTISMSSTKWKDNETTFNIDVRVSCNTPYGYFTQSGSASRRLSSDHRRRAQDLMDDAMRNLGRAVDSAVDRLGPDPISKHRKDTLDKIYAKASSKGR